MDGIKIGIETSSKITRMGYMEENRIVEISMGAYHRHSEYIIEIWRMLEEHIKDKKIEFIAISEGPGYFTSLRAGFSFAKALWFKKKVDFVGVNTLDALAYPFLKENNNLVAFIEIKKDKVFWKKFVDGKEVEFKMGKTEDVPLEKDFLYVGKDIDIEEKVKKCYPLEVPSIESIISIGELLYEQGKFIDMEKKEPLYFYTPSYVKSFNQES
jgi:tRNA threonylcarbamoyladenosine biosynthesis protein TsaB